MKPKRPRKKPSPADLQVDPQADQEAEKYENPIPSRVFILQYLEQQGKLLNREQLAKGLQLYDDEHREALRRRLRAMERDGQIIYTRRGFAPVDKLDLVRGRVIGHQDGFGFLVPDEGGDDLFLLPWVMESLMHGDRVVARVTGIDRRGRREGAVVEILERANHTIIGRYYQESGIGYVVADNKRIHQDILVPQEHQSNASNGQFVIVEILKQPARHRQPIGKIIEIVGDHMAPGMEIDVAIRSYNLPCEWPQEVEKEKRNFSVEVSESDKQNRKDLRNIPLVTIDGEDARDFDDAVFCERSTNGDGWKVLVAIADVSHYVKPGTALDIEAHERGNSVYFPEHVIPMLPEVLSNGLCSLNPEIDRLCMVCEMQIDMSGKITRSRFFEGLMNSHARLTYDQVAAMLVDKNKELRKKFAKLVPHLEELHALYAVMRGARNKRGAIDFDTTETKIVFGQNRKIEQIVPVVRNDAHMLIEECMIAANVCAARFLLRNKIPALYRVHDAPDGEKLKDLREFMGELGLQLKGGKSPKAEHYAELLQQVAGRPDAHLIQTVMLRSLKQAQYSPDNVGHFGLAHKAYAHFTSPIRRYPDLLVHRAIRHLLTYESAADFDYSEDDILARGEHCSMTGRRADEATRDAVNWLKCEYMMDKVGDEFDGIISSVTSFGIFVELEKIYVEGLVHITALHNDYYHYDSAHHRLRGEHTGKMYRLADKIRVQVVRVDLDDRKIDFEISGDSQKTDLISGKKKSGKSGSRKSGKKTVKMKRGENKGKGTKKESTVKESDRKKAAGKKKTKKKQDSRKGVKNKFSTKKRTIRNKKTSVRKKNRSAEKVTKKPSVNAKKTSVKKRRPKKRNKEAGRD